MPPNRARIDDTPATNVTAPTATQPRPWISVPISSPGAPPSTAAVPIRATRDQYGPPLSIMIDSSPPMAGSSASSCRPVANATAIGTQSASTARAIVPHGTGTLLGRTTSASQSGTTPISQSGTPSRAPPASRAPFKLRTRSKARDKNKDP